MTKPHWTLRLGTLGLGLLLALGSAVSPARADEEQADADAQAGVDVQGRGPVHEAFADPSINRPAPPVVAKKPPDPVDEMPPDQKPEGDNVQWLPGYWAYDDEAQDFMWVSGCWRAIPPDKQWMPGHWADVQNGYQWVSGFWADAGQEETDVVPQPPQTIEAGPSAPAPSADSVYVPGSWIYRTSQYAWRPGFWYVPQPGWIWVPARYVWTPAGWIFVEGYWDYPLEGRGVLFAPVVIDPRYRGQPRWVYRPRVIVYDTALVGCLFVRPGTGSYYFGDYNDARYRKLGFVAWVNYRPARNIYDPLYTATAWQHRRDPAWSRDLRTLYVNRLNGTAVRPPRTLVQQTTVIKTTNVTNVKNVTVLAPLTKVNRNVVKLQPVTAARLAQEKKSAQQLRAVSAQRQQISAKAVAKGPNVTKTVTKTSPAKVQLPRVTPVIKPQTLVKPPSAPAAARVVKPVTRKETKPVTKPMTGVKPPPRTEVKPPVRTEGKVPPVKTTAPVKPLVPPVKTGPTGPAKPEKVPPAKTGPTGPAKVEKVPPARTAPPVKTGPAKVEKVPPQARKVTPPAANRLPRQVAHPAKQVATRVAQKGSPPARRKKG